jgi:hypothetical protein
MPLPRRTPKSNPTVTITIGKGAVEAFLAQRDVLGARAD